METSDLFNAFRTLLYDLYEDRPSIPLHVPRIGKEEKKWVAECLETTMVSYVSPFVTQMENKICQITGSPFAVATVNGTSALQTALLVSGVQTGDLVLAPTLTFVATANAIRHAGAEPVFLDSDLITLGLSVSSLQSFLKEHTFRDRQGILRENRSKRKIAACVPVHIFGKPCAIQEILALCSDFQIPVVEDAAEALGSTVAGKACGTWGTAGILSFNGNKIVTTGGGGMILTADANLASRARHLTTTAKCSHPWEFFHDETAFNFRMPGLNAALGCAQLERFESTLSDKRETANIYQSFFEKFENPIVREEQDTCYNHWLNAIQFQDLDARNEFLQLSSSANIQCRPIWNLIHTLPMYSECLRMETPNAEFLQQRFVNIPSSVRRIS